MSSICLHVFIVPKFCLQLSSYMSQDEAVRETNDDAASCKYAAVHLGYWKDPYIDLFTKAGNRKAPEINRGYYARVHGIRSLLLQFLKVTYD